jgi:hypothetical protein
MNIIRIINVVCMISLFVCAHSTAQRMRDSMTVRGMIVDGQTNQRLPSVPIILGRVNNAIVGHSDSIGAFRFRMVSADSLDIMSGGLGFEVFQLRIPLSRGQKDVFIYITLRGEAELPERYARGA